jgi:hypothetical protein
MTTIPDHYAALGIDPTADQEVITAAYRALAKKFHPDTGAAGGTASAERFDQIQQAYEVLRTPESRHAYDLELLAATEAELQAHIASKRRVAVRERVREAERAAAAPEIDLGDIRPEPAVPPRGGQPPAGRKPRALFPFVVPLLLVAMVGGAVAWMFLPAGPEAPPLPGAEKQVVAEASPAPAPQPAATTAPKADQPAPQPQADSAEAAAPVFGSAAVTGAPQVKQAAATPVPASAPATQADGAAATPVFGSSASESASESGSNAGVAAAASAPQDPEAPAAPLEAAPPPLPKAKPAQPVKQAQKPAAAKPAQKQAQAVQKKPQQQPRARLAYQDPPAYFPEPDGFPPPPPGMEPPGFEPGYGMGEDFGEMPPPGYRPPVRGPYRLVIWERQPGRQATAWSAGVVFKSMGKCTRQGVKAVLRRTAGMDPYAENVRVWYECQRLSQR